MGLETRVPVFIRNADRQSLNIQHPDQQNQLSTLVLAIHCFLVGFVSLATIRTGEQKKEQAIRTDERNKVLQEIKIENGVFK